MVELVWEEGEHDAASNQDEFDNASMLMYQPVVAVREGGGDLQHDEETHDEE